MFSPVVIGKIFNARGEFSTYVHVLLFQFKQFDDKYFYYIHNAKFLN